MAESAAKIRRRAHLPEQPGEALRPLGGFGRQKGAELLGEIKQDRAGLEEADGLGGAAIDQCRDLGVGIDGYETAAELVTLIDLDQPSVVLGLFLAEREKLLEHDRDLLAVRSALGIELDWVAADRQLLVVGGARDRSVDVREVAAARLVPGPDLRGRVFGRTAHLLGSLSQGCRQAQSRRESSIGALLEGFPARPSATVAHASGVRQRLDSIVAALDVVEVEGVAERAESRRGVRRARSNL